jgi:hypothetical protein
MPKLETDGRERWTAIHKEFTIEKDPTAPEQTDANYTV